MSSLGEKIKAVFSSGSHSTEAEKGLVDHRTPGAFPVEESDTTGGHQPVAGTSDLGKDHEHNKLHKKGDPRGYTGLGEEGTSGVGHKHADNVTGLEDQRYVQQDTAAKNAPSTISSQPSTHNTSLATDQANRPDTSAVPGTGAVAAGAGGVAARELGEDRSGQKPLSQNTSNQDTLGRTSHLPTNTSRDDYTGTTTGRDTLGGNTVGSSTTGRDTLGGTTTGRDTLGGNTVGSSTTGRDTLGGTTGRDTTGLGTGRDVTGSNTTGSGLGETTGSHHPAATAGAVGAGALAGHELNRGADSKTGSTNQTEEPYWGDLPQGAGVYNTVTGHGSGEDTSAQHRTVPKPAGDASPHSTVTGNTTDRLGYGSGVYNTVVGHGSNDEHNRAHHTDDGQRAFPLNEHGNTASSETSHKDRHLGEAGAAVGAGAAAYGAEHHKHSKDKSSQLPASSEKTSHGEGLAHRPAEQSRDAPDSHGTGILHRHKDDEKTKPKHADVSSSDHPETYDNTGRHHNNKILGFMHSRKDEETARSQTSDAGTHGKDTLASGSHDRSLNEDHSHRDRNAALAGAGVGAAAATGYGVSHAQKHHDQTGSPAYQGQQGSVASNAQNLTSSSTAGQPGAYAQNPTSGNIGQSGAYAQSPASSNIAGQPSAYSQNPASGNATGQPGAYAQNPTSSNIGQPGAYSQNPTSGNVTGQPGAYNTSQLDASRGTAPTATHGSHIGAGQAAGLAGAGAAAGAGYGASKMGQHGTAGVPPTAGQDSYGHLSSGTSSGISPEARGQGQSTSTSGLGGQTGTSHGVAGGHSHGDQYNVLSSGTPSGVQVESTPTKSMGTDASVGQSMGTSASGIPAGQSMGSTGASGASFGQPGSHVTQECTKCGTTK